MRPYILPLALLFIAFTIPSDAQKHGGSGSGSGSGAVEVVVREGAPLTVECALRVEQRAEWRRDGGAPPADLRAAPERAAAGARLSARLRTDAARAHHAGLYTCTTGDPHAQAVRVLVLPPAHPHTTDAPATPEAAGSTAAPEAAGSAGAGAEPDPYADRPKTLVKFDLLSALTLNCTPGEPASALYQWLKNGTEIEKVSELAGRYALDKTGATLTVKRALENDFGNYTCLAGGEFARAWQAAARLLAKLPPNTNVVEGHQLSITCKLLGKPYERVAWEYAPTADGNWTALALATEAGGRFTTRTSPQGVPAGVLELSVAERADAGVYRCVPADGTAATTTLRVKDVYAALWPFIGICLEVIVLCAVILVYEKRRTKPELDDSDADTHDQ